MKELSIEQKAKAYDEAINKAESLYKAAKPTSDCSIIIETIFPEFKESEDEKIRKAIICGMYALKVQHKTYFASIPIDDVIAWLEKQGRLMKALQISNSKIGKLVEENYYLKEKLEKL